jgi:hypothetical protein
MCKTTVLLSKAYLLPPEGSVHSVGSALGTCWPSISNLQSVDAFDHVAKSRPPVLFTYVGEYDGETSCYSECDAIFDRSAVRTSQEREDGRGEKRMMSPCADGRQQDIMPHDCGRN